ncbi:CHASE domain-containing protein [Bermanella sp. R86510]|uniref:CHASE domain-containing protein n=1 Tax=unclassified Bermanella TaxID=2627862 RepID=UPI0037C61AB9
MKNGNSIKPPSEKKYSYKRSVFGLRSISAWFSLLLGLLFTGLTTFSLYQQDQKSAQTQFEIYAKQILKSVDKRLQDHELILLGATALMKVEENVSRQQWHEYVRALLLTKRYPGIQGVGYAEIFPANQLENHEKAIQAEGFPDYSVKPKGERQTYSGIKYLEPFSGRNLAAFGYDMYSNPIRREAMRRAALENTTTISGKVRLVQETHGKEQAGFLMYIPLYRTNLPLDTPKQRWEAIKGYVYSPYRMDDLIAGIFDRDEIQLDFQVFDGKSTEPTTLMYESDSAYDGEVDDNLTKLFQLESYGRTWTIKIMAQKSFKGQFIGSKNWLVPILGSGISFSIFIMMLVLMGRRESAQHLANEMIDQYKNAREHFHQQLSDVLSAASEVAIIATDTQGIITIFNSGAERLLGYQADELIGLASPALFHDPDEIEARSKALSEQMGTPISGFDLFVTLPAIEGSEIRDWTYINKNGELISVSLTVTPIRDDKNKITGFLGIAHDISERKRIELMKNEFISTVSHELRTPLTSVSGALGLVLSGHLGELSEKSERILNTAYRNSKRLAHLINDLLDIEKIAAGKLHFDMKIQPITPIIEQTIEENKAYCAERCVTINLTNRAPTACALVDEHRLKQVLANLLSNAIKFSPERDTVTIELKTDDDHIIVSVQDQGKGIPKDFRHKIFQKFAQADSSDTRQKGGTGLGLAISRELIEHMKGSIDFESTEGNGVRFFFKLPLENAAKELSSEKQGNPKAPDSMLSKILIIEDDVDAAKLLKEMVENAGYSADVCLDGLKALTALETQQYDLITLDLKLPDINGLEIIQRIRTQAHTANTPIVVISAKMEQGKLEFNGEPNSIEWLAKPIEYESLVSIVKRRLLDHEHPKLLHIEDDDDLHVVISAMVNDRMSLDHASNLQSARSLLKKRTYSGILLDIGLPDGLGWDLIPTIKAEQPDAAIIILTGNNVSDEKHDSVEAVLMKTRLTAEQLIDVIQSHINPNRKT